MIMKSPTTLLVPSLLVSSILISSARTCGAYPNVTLTSGELAVSVYLPKSLANLASSAVPGDQVFYESTRFEHGSMIGSIRRKGKSGASHHELYGANLWRAPHDPHSPEGGVGLASEFGVGDDGDFCQYRCGWNGVNDVTNGVLGYQQARNGESFLKIGVGELIKGSCASCDITEGYKFNSPYQFASEPLWSMNQPSVDKLVLEHEAHLKKYGYRIQKDISLEDDTLYVTTTLTNLGTEPFSTAWYSHHFFSCDGRSIGPGYELTMDLKENPRSMYEEPGLGGWSTQLRDYAEVTAEEDDTITVDMVRAIPPGTRIKAEFLKDKRTTGAFALKGCGTYIEEDMPEVLGTPNDPVPMYGFNLYMEAGTLSPEPQLLIQLAPSHSKTWTQRLVFSSPDVMKSAENAARSSTILATALRTPNNNNSNQQRRQQHLESNMSALAMLLVVSIGVTALTMQQRRRRRYTLLPNADLVL